MKILIAAGGSGGHLLPAQQLAQSLRSEADICFAGHLLDQSPFFNQTNFAAHSIASAPLKRSALLHFAKQTCRGMGQSLKLLQSFKPDLVIGFGSFHVFPILAAAVLLRKKIALFEANCKMGKVNRLFAPFSSLVACQFPIERPHCLVPLLPWKEKPSPIDSKLARKTLGLDPDLPTALVFGGSQGSNFLNQTVPLALPRMFQAIHLTGSDAALAPTASLYEQAGIRCYVSRFETNMPLVYAAADLAICRSGAGTMAELIGSALPAVLVPFPFASEQHQQANAAYFATALGAGAMVPEEQKDLLSQEILRVFERRDQCAASLREIRETCKQRCTFKDRLCAII